MLSKLFCTSAALSEGKQERYMRERRENTSVMYTVKSECMCALFVYPHLFSPVISTLQFSTLQSNGNIVVVVE